MKGFLINLAGGGTRLAYSIAAIMMVVGILMVVILGGLFGFIEFNPDHVTPEGRLEILYWLKVSGISAGVAFTSYLALQPLVPLFRIISRRELIQMEREMAECAFTHILNFYKKNGAINAMIVENIRKDSEQEDLVLLYSRYLNQNDG